MKSASSFLFVLIIASALLTVLGCGGEASKADYPMDSKDPVHLIDVIGSEEMYERLLNSPLMKPRQAEPSLRIGATLRGDQRILFVCLEMQGELVDVSVPERKITIANEGDTISLDVADHSQAVERYETPARREGNVIVSSSSYVGLEDLEVGEKLSLLACLNADTPLQARSIRVPGS